MADNITWDFILNDLASGAAGKIFHSIDKVEQSMNRLPFKTAMWEKSLSFLADAAREAAHLGMEFAKDLLHAADFGKENEVIFKALTGSSEIARQKMEAIFDVAQKGAIPISEVADDFRRLTAAKFDDSSIRTILAASSDLGKIAGTGTEFWTQMFVRIKNEGALAGRSILQLGNVLPLEKMAKSLLGPHARAKDLKKAMMEDKIEAGALMQAIVKLDAEMTGGVAGGMTAELAATTWKGAMVKISNAWEMTLDKLARTGVVEDVFSKLTSLVNDWAKPDKINAIADALSGVVSAMQALGKAAEIAAWPFIKIGEISAAMGVGGMTKSEEAKGAAWGRVFGLEKGGGEAARNAVGAAKFADLMGKPPVSSMGGKGHTVNLHIEVNQHGGSGAPDPAGAHELASQIKESTVSGLTAAFEQAAIEAGG